MSLLAILGIICVVLGLLALARVFLTQAVGVGLLVVGCICLALASSNLVVN